MNKIDEYFHTSNLKLTLKLKMIKNILFKCLFRSMIGLQALHEITSSESYKLRVDLEDWEGNQAYAEYS